ncbi:cysteine desulfurase family protein [Gracilibacillus phocaeensis]|uniref:cysteine desulfurase family protein n=1 Tax=Gracilibacillus phocaeensis TaxID=2042304 RepID=UPI001031DE42|nr:cysteine desulfurase family protein [Gracilibacillus phocaeensis]
MNAIYLDHAATTPVHPEVIEVMMQVYQENFGNPSSIHSFGRKARQILDRARATAAESIGADERSITFTSGGTEANNMAIMGAALANQAKGKHIVTTQIEHHAVLHTVNHLEKQGFDVTYLEVNEQGHIHVEQVMDALREDTILVSIMMVNNEIGTIQPIAEIGRLLHERDVLFHTDAVQAYGLLPIDIQALRVDLLTVSSHKINGPKGLGFLYADKELNLQPLQFGGEQERKRRAGTENVAGIAGFAKAIELVQESQAVRYDIYQQFAELFLQTLRAKEVDFVVNGDRRASVPTIINVSFPGTNVETLLMNFDLNGVAASSGSACTAGSIEPSHVLSAMFLDEEERTMNSVRFSFGLANDEESIREAADKIADTVNRLTR